MERLLKADNLLKSSSVAFDGGIEEDLQTLGNTRKPSY